MKFVNVTTPDNIMVEYRLAGAGSRIAAAIVDTAVQVFAFVLTIAAALLIFYNLTGSLELENISNIAAFLIISYFIIFFSYFIVFEIVTKGQTLGKKIFGLRTIRQNGQPITITQSLIRNIIRVIIDNQGVGIAMMLLGKSGKRLGDILAGTIVISENPSKIRSSSLLMAENENYEASFLKLTYPITLEEYEILKDYFARRNDFLDNGDYAAGQISNYFAEKFTSSPENFSEEALYRIMAENSQVYK